eukprot:CAMPEP_0203864424 /NCGR_PEP_ID=MMETSP0359-20131031/14750_1 /ASSEMBLY_ACC=CAM_ASM_000338 /TAXON_ID=268821 /ORGANISM="Scrippsiella Hangoei, Strain SHTV-5" /LENGTH=98 /DNA_ID=CAMNT_0050782151 /DNA_START=132 /DNA_END=426 /DNA_ORIENTATION=+
MATTKFAHMGWVTWYALLAILMTQEGLEIRDLSRETLADVLATAMERSIGNCTKSRSRNQQMARMLKRARASTDECMAAVHGVVSLKAVVASFRKSDD